MKKFKLIDKKILQNLIQESGKVENQKDLSLKARLSEEHVNRMINKAGYLVSEKTVRPILEVLDLKHCSDLFKYAGGEDVK